MGLNEDVVDLLEVDGAGLVTHRFDKRGQAQVAGAAQEAIGGADDQGQGVRGSPREITGSAVTRLRRSRISRGKGVVAQAGAVQLGQDEVLGGLRPQAGQDDRVRDAGAFL